MVYSLKLYRRTRQTLRESLGSLRERGMKRLALYGTGEAAELAYLTLKEHGLEPVGVYAASPDGTFLGFPVLPVTGLDAGEIDGLVVATFEPPEPHVRELQRRGVPRAKCVTLRRMPA
jgi:hypothetical protein